MNSATDVATGGNWRNLLGYDNPLALERTPYNTHKGAAYGYITEGAFTAWSAAAGGGAASAGARSSLSVVPEANASTSLFRAVSKSELDDILVNGFRSNPNLRGYQTEKLFATSVDDAAQFGRNNFRLDGVPNFIVETQAPGTVMRRSLNFRADSMNAVSVSADQLNLLKNVRVCNFSPTCQ